jgi:hypothetical protein
MIKRAGRGIRALAHLITQGPNLHVLLAGLVEGGTARLLAVDIGQEVEPEAQLDHHVRDAQQTGLTPTRASYKIVSRTAGHRV